jgi:hypothetical protein
MYMDCCIWGNTIDDEGLEYSQNSFIDMIILNIIITGFEFNLRIVRFADYPLLELGCERLAE